MSDGKLEKILYVEDEPDIRAVAKIALESVGGFSLKICSAGEEAIKQATEFNPDLLLLDVTMPGMDGPTTLMELRKLSGCADTPAVFVTARAQPKEVAHFKSLGAIDVIAKPFDPKTLAKKVQDAWDRAAD